LSPDETSNNLNNINDLKFYHLIRGSLSWATTKSFMKTGVFTPTHETGILMADILPYAGSHDTRLGRESSWPLVPAGTQVFSGR